MAAIPGISSNDPAFASAVADWLLGSRMPMPRGLRLHLEVVDRVDPVEDAREAFAQGDVDIRAGDPLGWVHLSWRAAPATARIEPDLPHATVQVSREAVGELDYMFRSFLLIALIFLWKRDRRFHVHAGTAIDPRGRGWMLIGDSRSGKSTTTALLATRGWQVSTDDIAFLEARDERAAVLGFRSPIALRPGGFDLLGKAGGVPLPRRSKTGFWPEELGAAWVQRVEPEIVVFTTAFGERTSLTPAAPAEIIRELMQWSMWVLFESTAAQEHLDLLSRLGRQGRCYKAVLGPDLFAAPRALEDFLP